jgi:polysulfide reductase-like protein
VKERALVPAADFRSYYGRPILKAPVWKQPDVPLYLFLGGLAGSSSVLAEGAAATGRPALQRVARITSAGGAALGTVALIHDLGRPERFLHMLRVFKPTSPLSVGSWILSPFAAFSSAALASDLTGVMPRLGRLAGIGAAMFGPPLVTYTGALICNTAVPAWHEGYREMPFLFAGSGMAAAGGLGMVAVPVDQAGPARRMAVLGAAMELVASESIQKRLGMLAEPYQQGRPGLFMRTARRLTMTGLVGSALGGRSRMVSVASGLAYMSASVFTRFGVFQAGLASAKDPKYTVVPQRERVQRKHEVTRTVSV